MAQNYPAQEESANIEKATATELRAQNAPYSAISNATVDIITNPDALAIWTYLQTRAPGWKVIGSYLQDRFDMGRIRYRKAMKYLADVGLITHKPIKDESGRMAGRRVIIHYQPKVQVPDASAPKVQVSERSESASLAETTPYVINQENQQSNDVNTNGASAPADDGFETAWKAYPKREGANPKNKAHSAWKARLKEGVTAEAMMAGVARYAAYCQAKGNTGTEYVMQAQRFFGKGREFDNEWTAAAAKPSRHHGFDQRDYYDGLTQREDGTHAF